MFSGGARVYFVHSTCTYLYQALRTCSNTIGTFDCALEFPLWIENHAVFTGWIFRGFFPPSVNTTAVGRKSYFWQSNRAKRFSFGSVRFGSIRRKPEIHFWIKQNITKPPTGFNPYNLLKCQNDHLYYSYTCIFFILNLLFKCQLMVLPKKLYRSIVSITVIFKRIEYYVLQNKNTKYLNPVFVTRHFPS